MNGQAGGATRQPPAPLPARAPQPKDMGLPVHAYLARDEVREDGTEKSKKVFVNLPTEVGATEAEEIGVEHLLRDVKDASISTLSSEVGARGWGGACVGFSVFWWGASLGHGLQPVLGFAPGFWGASRCSACVLVAGSAGILAAA